ncbi:unnamed protein product [Rhodiola kirilowii]
MKTFRLHLLLFAITLVSTPVLSDLVISKVDRRINLSSQIVRITSSIKVVNEGPKVESEVLLAFVERDSKNLAFLSVSTSEGKGKAKASAISLPLEIIHREGTPEGLILYSASLPKELKKGESLSLDILAVYTHVLKPFPEKITQSDIQLVVFQDSAHFLSPYPVKTQSVTVTLPGARIESYSKIENTKIQGSDIKYGPYENIPSFSYLPVVVHFESNQPFAVARELEREIEISHWGNVQITEHYKLVHDGAQSKGEFSRLDYQMRPHLKGASAFRHLVAKLPPRAHSVYYRDDIGNISTSHLWGDFKKTELVIEPRYPMLGGWRTSFTIGYGLPLEDFLFISDGKRFLNITFGCPMNEVIIDNLVVKVVLPEGSNDISVSVPFPVKQGQETKFSHLDVVGRPVIVLEKTNVVPELNQHFQVYYKFNNLSLLREPFMLIAGFFILFLTCIVYVHADMSISKNSTSYLAKLQWEEVQATVQQVHSIISKCLLIHDKLEASLRDLSRTGDVQACKGVRKAADSTLKDLSKEVKLLLTSLHSSPQAAHVLPKVEELANKERELQEKLMAKHSTVVDSIEKKSGGGREIENKIAALQQKVAALRYEVDELMDVIDEI